MSEMFQELLKSSPYAIIELYELHLVQDLHGSSDVVRFHGGVNQKMPAGDIVWNSKSYQALPVEVEGFEYTGSGQLPRPKVRVANLLGSISALLLGVNEFTPGNDLTGAKFIRIRTLSRFLDPVNFTDGINPYGTPDPTAEMPQEIYYVDRKAAENRDVVEWELAAVFDLAGIRAPKRQCIANICQWKYRGPECGYTGTTYFNENDETIATTPAANIAATFTTLNFGENLLSPNQMVSSNGWYRAVLQSDGNLAVYSKNSSLVWASNTGSNTDSYRLRNQVDGNLVITNLTTSQVKWQTYTANTSVGVTSAAFVRDSAGGIGWVPTDITEGRSGSFGWELFGSAALGSNPGGAESTASRTFYSPTTISPGRFITIQFLAHTAALPAGHYSGQAYKWDLQSISVTASGGFWNLNETFNATVSIGGSNPFRNTSQGMLTSAGPQIQITGTTGYASNKLIIQNDGNLVLYDNADRAIWSSGYSSADEPMITTSSSTLITVDPAKDVCGKRITSCKARFGSTAELPFGSFPSIGTYYG
jgi:hypothetical protein